MSRRREASRETSRGTDRTSDPLRLCVFTTIALLTWLVGPAIVAVMAGLAFVAYLRAWRAGQTSSRCILRDTRLVLGYLGIIAVLAMLAVARQLGALLD